MNDSEIDMDELEARLYGQVYHMPNDNEEFATPTEFHTSSPIKTFTRYFEDNKSKPSSINTNQIPQHGNRHNFTSNFNYDRMGVYSIPVLNPVNNIVVLPSPPTQIFTQRQGTTTWFEKLFQTCAKRAKNKEKRERKKLRRKMLRQELYLNSPKSQKRNNNKTDIPEVINVSDVKQESVIICEDSDSNTNASDVIIVETTNEVISIDCDEPPIPIHSPTLISCETVDSLDANESVTSNDFLDNTVVMQKDDGKRAKSISPLKHKEMNDVGSSSSSTMDYTENFRGITRDKVFNEKFNAHSNNTFSELNLDTFTNYIECDGKTSQEIPSLSTSLLDGRKSKHLQKKQIDNSSDSSSESEYNSDVDGSDGNLKNPMYNFDAEVDVDDENDCEANPNGSTEIDNTEIISIDCDVAPLTTNTDVPTLNDNKEMSVIELDASVEAEQDDIICIDDETVQISNLAEEEISVPNVKNGEGNKPKKFTDYWTDDMNKFYKDSWGGENFSLIEEQRRMSDDPNMWKVNARDRININFSAREPRCRRCREFGHIAVRCTKKLNPPKCILCGASGHLESRCPDKMCTSCGQWSSYYTTYCSLCAKRRYVRCTTCNFYGHIASRCPDLWRRYTFTTSEGPVQQPESHIKPTKDRWCSGCASNGHFEQNCHYYNRSHAAASVFIHSYKDIYGTDNNTHKSVSDSAPSTSNIQHMDKNEEPSSITVVDEEVTTTGLYLEVNSNRNEGEHSTIDTDWNLNNQESKALMGKEGKIFLSVLEKKTDVSIDLRQNNLHKYCIVKGTAENKVLARSALARYCSVIDLAAPTSEDNVTFKSKFSNLNTLKQNLNCLNNANINWFQRAQILYANIMNVSKKIGSATAESYGILEHSLKKLYTKLNTIIIGKLQIGRDKEHMKILEHVNNKKGLEQSFKHVFNSDFILFPNYQELIFKLPQVDNEPLLLQQLKRMACGICQQSKFTAKFRQLIYLYSLVIIYNYSAKHVSLFKNEVTNITNLGKKQKKESRRSKKVARSLRNSKNVK